MAEAEWQSQHPSPSWLSEFESLAVSVVGSDPAEREASERLLKKWVDSQHDGCTELLKVIQSSQSFESIIVAVLLLKNTALKKWGQSQEGQLL